MNEEKPPADRIGRRGALGLMALAAPAGLSAERLKAPACDKSDGALVARASRAAASRQSASPDCSAMVIAGYATPGDGGGGRYVRVARAPCHAGSFQTVDGAWYEIDEPVVSPRQFGARADGGDDAPAIQAMLDAVIGGTLRARPHLGGGVYSIGQTVELPFRGRPGAIDGDGMLLASTTFDRHGPNTTVLSWSGPAGGTMIGGKGVGGLSLRDMTLQGRANPRAPRAGILFHCEQDRTNASGSGVGLMEQVNCCDADVAIQMGTLVDDGNCADWTFVRAGFFRCGVGLRVVDRQGLNYSFLAPSAVTCGSLMRMEHGGHVYATNVQISSSGGIGEDYWLLDFRELGDGAAMAVIDGLRLEHDCRQALRSIGGTVLLRAYEEAQAPQACTMVEVRGGTLVLDGARLVSRSRRAPHFRLGRGPGGASPRLVLRDVFFDVTEFRLEEWILCEPGAEASVTMERCSFANGEPIAGFNTQLTDGSVTLFGHTAGAAATRLSLGGQPAREAGEAALLPRSIEAMITARVIARRRVGSTGPSIVERRALVTRGPHRAVVPVASDQGRGESGIAAEIVLQGDAVTVEVRSLAGTAIDWTASIEAVVLPPAVAGG